MISRIAGIVFSTALLVACAPVPKQAPDPPAPETEAITPPAEATEPQPLATVDVRAMKCSTLMGASDDDKAYASTFLLGYRSALMHSHTIEIKKIEAIEIAALSECAKSPDAIASKVFAVALARIGISAEAPPVHRVHHREPPVHAAPTETAPAQAAPSPVAPAQTPPLQWNPAQSTPPQPMPAQPAPTQPSAEPPPGEFPPSEGSHQ